MPFSSSLTSIVDPLVLDTSVLINLHACKFGEQVLAALPNEILVPDTVAGELEHETSVRNGEFAFLKRLVQHHQVSVTPMTHIENQAFYELTSSPPTLDDGEAATISIASTRRYGAVIDERKGRQRAANLKLSPSTHWSLDLLLHPLVVAALGEKDTVDALYFALFIGRMRIPAANTEDVILLMGMERSRKCTCLPGFRYRFPDL